MQRRRHKARYILQAGYTARPASGARNDSAVETTSSDSNARWVRVRGSACSEFIELLVSAAEAMEIMSERVKIDRCRACEVLAARLRA